MHVEYRRSNRAQTQTRHGLVRAEDWFYTVRTCTAARRGQEPALPVAVGTPDRVQPGPASNTLVHRVT